MRAEITGDPLLSIVITSYTMERFKDICDLFDSIKSQTILNPTQQTQETQPTLEVIFVAERSRELYERVKAYAEGKSHLAQSSQLTKQTLLTMVT